MVDAGRSAKNTATSARPASTRRAAKSGGRSPPVKVSIVQQPGADTFLLLEQSLENADFWQHIERARSRSRLRQDRFRIAIKPDLDFFAPGVPAGTDPTLVEHLIDLLHDRGFRSVVVGDGRNAADAWLYNRDPLVVPELVGYRFVTPKGRPYDLVDLQSDFPTSEAGGSNSVGAVSKHWLDADYRISFAKNKTHEEFFFALCVHNLAGLMSNKDAQDGSRSAIAAEACLGVLRAAPPHFSIIDASRSCHGGAGHRAFVVAETCTIIASADAVLADWAGAAKMGLDPHSSPINDKALRQIGLPKRYELDGSLAPYPLWRNVHPLMALSARYRGHSADLGRIAEPWFQTVDRENFPFREFYNDRINSFISPLMAQLDTNSEVVLDRSASELRDREDRILRYYLSTPCSRRAGCSAGLYRWRSIPPPMIGRRMRKFPTIFSHTRSCSIIFRRINRANVGATSTGRFSFRVPMLFRSPSRNSCAASISHGQFNT